MNTDVFSMFGVASGATLDEFKKGARRKFRQTHPDMGGDAEEFKRLRREYEYILENHSFFQYDRTLYTDNGTPLSELGQGLGPTTNGTDCGSCNGNGYREFTDRKQYLCTCCRGRSFWIVKHGKKWAHCPAESCSFGYFYRETKLSEYYVCWECKGRGEIEIYNPVILKGRLTT